MIIVHIAEKEVLNANLHASW